MGGLEQTGVGSVKLAGTGNAQARAEIEPKCKGAYKMSQRVGNPPKIKEFPHSPASAHPNPKDCARPAQHKEMLHDAQMR